MAAASAFAAATPLWTPIRREAWAQTDDVVLRPQGTTYERSIGFATDPADGYARLEWKPGWPLEVRTEFAEPSSGREDRRVALLAFLHGTDYQFPDAQSPARVEFLNRYSGEAGDPDDTFVSGAFRPGEALVLQACEAIHRKVLAMNSTAPVTGRRLDFTVQTGDNYDNKQANELRWFLTVMNGGEVAANSGDDDAYEGVQIFGGENYDRHYYYPDLDGVEPPPPHDSPPPDHYRTDHDFPAFAGLLSAAIEPFDCVGIRMPWYQTYGNHDALAQGNERINPAYEEIAEGEWKIVHPTVPGTETPLRTWRRLMDQDDPSEEDFYLAFGPPVNITPDPERRFIFDRDYVRAHLDSPGSPTGHGFTEWNYDNIYLFYSFDLGESIAGISLDTCAPVTAIGAVGDAQMGWLEEELTKYHSHYYEADGTEVSTGNDDKLVIIFGHHRFGGIEPIQGQRQIGGRDDDDDAPGALRGPDGYVYRLEQQHDGDALRELLFRFPNVIAYVTGHSHVNRVAAHADPAGLHGGIWEITTSAQIDAPQQARVLEVVDNRDGTLSIFSTIIDHTGDPGSTTNSNPYDLETLAAIGREIGYNDPQGDIVSRIGEPTDLNVELLLPAPFELFPTPEREEEPDADDVALPATGGGALAGLGAAALAGAIALRNRGPDDEDEQGT